MVESVTPSSMASWICAPLVDDRTLTVAALPLNSPPVLRSASRSTEPPVPTLSVTSPTPSLLIAALTIILLAASLSSFTTA